MSKSKYVNVRGIANWAKVFEDNREMTDWQGNPITDTDGLYVINLDLDDDEFEKLKASGSQAATYAKDADGLMRVKLKRPHYKEDSRGNHLPWASGPPSVFKADGSKWDFESDGMIGNGSEVEVRVCVYRAGSVVGTRLEGIKVIKAEEVPDYDASGFEFHEETA